MIGQTELFLAALGCHGITRTVQHPQTQGKTERSHQTLIRFLDAHTPKTLEQLSKLVVKYREHYNYRRRHQALKIGTTYLAPAQSLEAVPERVVRLLELPEDVVEIRRSNPQIYYRGRIFKVPTHLVGTYQLVTTATGFTLFDSIDGAESLFFPLPVRVASSKRLVPFWQVYGARIRKPHPAWEVKRIEYDNDRYQTDLLPCPEQGQEFRTHGVNEVLSDYIPSRRTTATIKRYSPAFSN